MAAEDGLHHRQRHHHRLTAMLAPTIWRALTITGCVSGRLIRCPEFPPDMGPSRRLSTRRSCQARSAGFWGKSARKVKKIWRNSDASVQSPPPANSFACPSRAWDQNGSWSHLVRGLASLLRRPLPVLHFPSIWHSPMCRGPKVGGTRDLWYPLGLCYPPFRRGKSHSESCLFSGAVTSNGHGHWNPRSLPQHGPATDRLRVKGSWGDSI